MVRSNLRLLHGSFGPKLQAPGPVRLFVTAKGGLDDFGFSNAPATFGTFTGTVSRLRANNANAVFYPGGASRLSSALLVWAWTQAMKCILIMALTII